MTRFGWLVVLIVLLMLAGIIGGWYLIMRYHPPQAITTPVATSTPAEQKLLTSSIYTNGVYGFSVIYPESDTTSADFTPWRTGAIATGTPIVQFTDTDGLFRIGASNNAKEVKACTKAGPAETTLPNLQLGSTTFKGFTHDAVGTDRPQRITSYRTIHEKACVALETILPIAADGSVASSTAINGMLQGFSFARL